MPTMRAVKALSYTIFFFFALPLFAQQEGLASWYGGKFDGRLTSSGEVFDTNEKTAAHRTLPFGTIVRVVNLDNQKSTVVKINDRGPFVEGRVIDLSRAAADEIGMVAQGVARVSLEIIEIPPVKDLYLIQVGAYSLEWNADKTRQRLEGEGFIVSLEKTPIGIIRVLVRGVNGGDLADVRGRLEALGYKKLVVREEKTEMLEASAG